MRNPRTSIIAIVTAALMAFAAGPAAAQDWRGTGRMSGKITDDSGQPIADAVVKATHEGSRSSAQAKTNKKGEWSIVGIGGGHWHLEFSKDGYLPSTFELTATEQSPNAPVMTELRKAPVDPNAVIAGDLKTAADLVLQKKYREARAIYEGILQKYPQAYQVEPYIARTYYEEKNYDQAIAHLQNMLAKEPDNINAKLLLAQVYGQKGDAAQSQQVLSTIDDSKITDPTIMLNVGIGLLNQQKPDEALTWFDKTVTRFPTYADGYYYRGITEVQQAKNDQAKADLQKFVQMVPNAPEAATAKGILEKLK